MSKKTGRWIRHGKSIWTDWLECSECGYKTIQLNGPNFCSNCGEDMREAFDGNTDDKQSESEGEG